MSIRPLFDRSLLVSSKKDIRSDLALKFAKQELSGESATAGTTSRVMSTVKTNNRLAAASTLLDELVTLQSQGHSPIIVVPSSSSSKSRLTCLNALKFLQNGIYEEPNVRTMTRPNMPLELERSVLGGKATLRFRIIDDTSKLRKEDWKCIVAVFTEGKMWQFSGWPFRSDTDLFSAIIGFNLRYTDDQVVEPLVISGRIKSLLLRRASRHQDSAVMIEFWRHVEAFLSQPRDKRISRSTKLP
jgi:hypothetical protein